MICTILFAIASAFAINYQAGDSFSYTYGSHVETAAIGQETTGSHGTVDVTCKATFTVSSVVADGMYLQLVVSDLSGKVSGASTSQLFSQNAAVDEFLAAPLYFKLKNDGSITDVVANKDDSDEVLNIKTAVAFSIRTHINAVNQNEYAQDTVIDTLGKHVEYTSVSQRANSRTINTFFSDSDFVGFADRNLEQQYVAIDSHSSHVLSDDKVTAATSEMTIILNKKASSDHSNDEQDFQLTVSGTSSLSNYQETHTGATGEMQSLAKFLAGNRNYAMVNKFREAYYLHTFTAAPFKDVVISDDGCPGNIDLCKSIDGSWTIGNTNIGLLIHTWALAGVTTGCTEAHRSYMAGAYATLDILILEHNISAVDAYIEYGQVDGIAKRNAISLSLFGQSIYYQAIPYLNCITKDYPLASWNKEFRLPYTTQVYVVTLTFYISLTVNLSASVTVKVCPMEFNAQATLTPKAQIAVGGGAEAGVVIAKVGITLRGSTSDSLNPTAYVDGNLCRVGFYAYNKFGGLTASLVGYFEVFDLVSFIKSKSLNFTNREEFPIWSYSIPGRQDKIIDVYWGAQTSE